MMAGASLRDGEGADEAVDARLPLRSGDALGMRTTLRGDADNDEAEHGRPAKTGDQPEIGLLKRPRDGDRCGILVHEEGLGARVAHGWRSRAFRCHRIQPHPSSRSGLALAPNARA